MATPRAKFLPGALGGTLLMGGLFLAAACEMLPGTPPPGAELQPGFEGYRTYCARCHGLGGYSGRSRRMAKRSVSLVDPVWRATADRDTLRQVILLGKGKMDGFEGEIDPGDLEGILDFLFWMPVDSTLSGDNP